MWGYAWSDLIVCFRVGSKVKDVTFFWGMFCSSFKNSCLSDLHHKFQKKILCSVTLNVSTPIESNGGAVARALASHQEAWVRIP